MIKRSLNLIVIVLLLFGITSGFWGCSSKSVSDDITATTSMSLTTSPPALTVGETSVIEATLSDGAVAVPNQALTFSVSPSTVGYVSPTIDTTDASGIAATVFTATQSGTATITVSLVGSSLQRTVGITVSDEQLEGSGNVNISVSPSLLIANGADTARVTITVRDAAGSPAPNGTVVFITAGEKFDDIDGNGYWTQNVDTVVYDANANGLWDAIGFIPSTATVAGGNGIAEVDFVSGNNALTVYIRATVNDGGISGHVEKSIQLNPNAVINSIYLSSDSLSLSVKQTGGIETGLLRAVCYDFNGDPVPEGITVNFTILNGPGGGEHLGNVGYGPYVAKTNNQGVATSTIHSGTVSGTVRVRANADTVLSNAAQVLISAGPPKYIVVGAEYCNINYWDDVAHEVEITAIVSDTFLNPVNDSTVVYFWSDEGTMKSHEERTKEWEGIATTIWFSGNNVNSADGKVWIYAETAGGTVACSTMFYNTHDLAFITVNGLPDSLWATSTDKLNVNVYGFDFNMNPVVEGTVVRTFASPEDVTVTGGNLSDGCGIAAFSSEIKSKTLAYDRSLTGVNDDGIGSVVNITYSAANGDAASSWPVYVKTEVASWDQSIIEIKSQSSSVEYGEEVRIVVTIKDIYTNPLGDHTISFTTSAGTLSDPTAETGGNGKAQIFLTVPDISSGVEEIIITATDTDPRGSGVRFTKAIKINANPSLSVSTPSLDFGTATTVMTFEIFNSGEGGTINWRLADDKTWITTNVTSGSTTSETDVVTVTIDRTGLTAGDYDGLISISSDAGSATVTINMTVP